MKPILFNTDMARALLANRKTVTRRVVRNVSVGWEFVGIEKRPYELRTKADGTEYPKELDWPHAVFSAGDGFCDYPMRKAPYLPGDILYVRETFGTYNGDYYLYRADYPDGATTYDFDGHRCDLPRWSPSIHMPREAARIFLRVTDVQVERLQDVTEEDAIKEGCTAHGGNLALDEFEVVWHNTLKPTDRSIYGWDANPWVWVIEFERRERKKGD